MIELLQLEMPVPLWALLAAFAFLLLVGVLLGAVALAGLQLRAKQARRGLRGLGLPGRSRASVSRETPANWNFPLGPGMRDGYDGDPFGGAAPGRWAGQLDMPKPPQK